MPAPTGHPGPRTDLHKHLIRWRENAQLTRIEFARMLGRHESPIRMWETGLRKITIEGLAELASVYGVPPAALLRPPPHVVKPVMGKRDDAPHRHLADWRLSLGLSRSQVQERSGIPEKTLINWESGERGVDLDALQQLARAYNVTPAALLRQPTRKAKMRPGAEKADERVQANIEAWRLHVGMSRLQVCLRANCRFGHSALYEWEKMNRPMPAWVVKVLARIYGVKPDDLRRQPPVRPRAAE